MREVLEGIKFPATRNIIFKALGWKLVELEDGKQVKVEQLLKDIPPKTYDNADEVMQEVKFQ